MPKPILYNISRRHMNLNETESNTIANLLHKIHVLMEIVVAVAVLFLVHHVSASRS